VPEQLRVAETELEPLVRRAGRLAAAGERRLLGLTGPPGVGKSTIAAALVAALDPAAVLVPMDGFHLAAAELHRLGRHERKGAPDTFDAPGFVALLRRLRHPVPGVTVWAPRFDRGLEEPIAGAIAVEPAVPLVVTEGNYLLLAAGGWAPVRELLDEVWFLACDEPTRLARLTARHVAYGRSPEQARQRATRGSDARNAALIVTTRHRADLIVPC
jgi:pantothenate kinase